MTDESLAVPGGKICPTAGFVLVTLPDNVTHIGVFYRSTGGVDIDKNGNSTIEPDEMYPSCLDPRLLMCAA